MTTTTSSPSEAARRYAYSLFAIAESAGNLEDIHTALTSFAELIGKQEALRELVTSPLYMREDKSKVLQEIARKADAPDLIRRFLGVVSENGRAKDLISIAAAFDVLYADHKGIQTALVRTPDALDKAQEKRLIQLVATSLGCDTQKINLIKEVDPDLIGGLQLRIGSKLVDASLKAKLERLNNVIKGV